MSVQLKISIVTPSLNQGRFIERTILSVACQDSMEFEIEHIVFDGGSCDNTLDILKKHNDKVTWFSEPDKGQSDAVNKGFALCSGEIIGWLNSDDTYTPGALQRIVSFFNEHPAVDIIYGDANHIDEYDNVIEKYPTQDWDAEVLMDTCYICQPAVFFRKSTLVDQGALDSQLNYCMDYEFWLRLTKAGKRMTRINSVLANSRLYEENKTLGSRTRVHKEICEMFKKNFGRVPDKWLCDYAHAVLEGTTLLQKRRNIFARFFYSFCVT